MKSRLLLIVVTLLYSQQQVRGATCPAPDDADAMTRLKSTLFCKYDRMSRPVKQRNTNITISISLDLKYLEIVWNDQHLVWDPKLYENITDLIVPSEDIWVPDISIYNSDLTQIMLFRSTTCMLSSKGSMKCAPDLRTPVYCVQNLRKWPYDQQNCSLLLGSWAHAGEEIDVQLQDGKGYRKYLFMDSKAWELVEIRSKREATKLCCPNSTYPHLAYSFLLKRHAAMYAASIIVPAFVLAGLALSSFWVSGVACRACVCCAAMLGDALFLQYIGYHLPADGDTSPNIVAYYRDAMLLAVVALALSIAVEGLRERTADAVEPRKQGSPAPQWLAGAATWLRGSGGRAGQLLLGDTEAEADAEAAPAVRESEAAATPRWITFATLIDRASFLALTITYIILLMALLP